MPPVPFLIATTVVFHHSEKPLLRDATKFDTVEFLNPNMRGWCHSAVIYHCLFRQPPALIYISNGTAHFESHCANSC